MSVNLALISSDEVGLAMHSIHRAIFFASFFSKFQSKFRRSFIYSRTRVNDFVKYCNRILGTPKNMAADLPGMTQQWLWYRYGNYKSVPFYCCCLFGPFVWHYCTACLRTIKHAYYYSPLPPSIFSSPPPMSAAEWFRGGWGGVTRGHVNIKRRAPRLKKMWAKSPLSSANDRMRERYKLPHRGTPAADPLSGEKGVWG